jgi:hypothetical protein
MAKIKIPRAEITQPAVGGGRDLIGVAAGNAVGTGLQDLVTKFATYEIKKNKVEEDTRINLKVQDRTSLLNSELEEEVNNIINDPNFAFLPDNELEKKWQKIEARVQAQYKKDQKEDPNFAKYYFSNMNTVLTRNKSLYRREKAKYLGVKTQQIVEDAGPTIINELAKIPPGSAKDAALNHFVSYVIPNTEKLALRYQIKYDSKKEIKQIKLAALEQNLLSQNDFIRKDGSPDYAAALKYVKDENNIDALGLFFDDGEGDLRDDLAKVLFDKNNDQADQDEIAFKQENNKNFAEAFKILKDPSKYPDAQKRLQEIKQELTNPLNVEGQKTLERILKVAEEKQGGKSKTLSGALVFSSTAELIRNEELISRNQKYKLAGEKKALSINDRYNLEGPSGLNRTGFESLSNMLDNSDYADATKLLEEKSQDFRATFIGPEEIFYNDSIADREYETKVDFLREIMLEELKAGISVDALFDPNNEKYIFRDANLLPLTATREDINRMEDESLGLNVMSAEQKAIYIKKIKDSDEDVSEIVTEDDDKNKQEVNKFLRENPETINEYLLHRPITDVPEDLQEIVKPFIKNPQVEETQDEIGQKIGTSSEDPNRPVFKQGDENVSELSTTFEYPQGSGKIINIPSIHNGKQYNQDELIKMLDAGTIKPTSTHNSYEEAEQAAEERSKSIRIMEEE